MLFFDKVIGDNAINDNGVVSRWGSHIEVCVFGEASTYSNRNLSTLFTMFGELTYLDFTTKHVSNITECSDTATLYVKFHSGEKSVLSDIVGDISYIQKMNDMFSPMSVNLSRSGMGFILPSPRPRMYMSVDQFNRSESVFDSVIASNVIQQELLQLLLLAADVGVKFTPRSLIEERYNFFIASGDEGSETKYRKKWARDNVWNICRYDAMLLLSIYSPETIAGDGTLNFYREFVRRNFSRIENDARDLIADPRFSSLIKRPC
ncbi:MULTISPECIES: hypothetical protein [Rhizobium/Agrobacterium group]|uniref:hypothetical protein n=1 Tax=Rhizobium/Agrobacterium group TaxID=227290 RepID=UPI002300AD4C|nr:MULTISPECIES: hypothetical protein [Rhizobium/Agrobacterium group]MDA5633685.1 hypothetical protein [Agrobacterium sp. ST15.16.024]MDF1889331.1 hypothetical protein [Rhizobium rhizogenes]